jgi:hypothetical protein
MAKIKASGNRVPLSGAKIETNPESENELREQEANAERERLLDELGRCFVQAAVTRLLKERDVNPRRATLSDH